MNYVDFDRLERIDPQAYRSGKPYPWVNPANLLTEAGFEALRHTLPALSLFEARFGKTRKEG